MRKLLVAFAFFIPSWYCIAQSTSPWMRIAESTIGDPMVTNASAGATYMTVAFLAASVYQNSNWYTALVDKNR